MNREDKLGEVKIERKQGMWTATLGDGTGDFIVHISGYDSPVAAAMGAVETAQRLGYHVPGVDDAP